VTNPSDNDVDKKMSPSASPGALKSGVRRINNVPIYIVVAVLVLFACMMAMVAAERSRKQNAPAKEQALGQQFTKPSIIPTDIIDGSPRSGLIEASAPEASKSVEKLEPGVVLIARPENLDKPPMPPHAPLLPPGQAGTSGSFNQHQYQQPQYQQRHDDEAERIRTIKLQAFQEAVRARTIVRAEVPRMGDSSYTHTGVGTPGIREADPTAAFQKRLAQIRGLGLPGGLPGGGDDETFKIIQAAAPAGTTVQTSLQAKSG